MTKQQFHDAVVHLDGFKNPSKQYHIEGPGFSLTNQEIEHYTEEVVWLLDTLNNARSVVLLSGIVAVTESV